MSSRIIQIHTDLLSALKSVPKTYGSLEKLFNYVNIWDSQIDDSIAGKSYNQKTPSGYVEVELNEGESGGFKYVMYPNAEVKIHIIDNYLNSRGGSMEQNLRVFSFRDLVKKTILSSDISFCSSFICVEDKMDYKHDNIYKYVLTFKTCFIDSIGSVFDPNSGLDSGQIDFTLNSEFQ